MPTPPFLLTTAQMRRLSPNFPLSHGIPRVDDWPAAGLVDTEIRFSNRIGGFHAATSVQPRVQA